MNFGPFGGGSTRAESPALSSRAGSPQPRVTQPDDAKIDKASRRYAAIIERTLATWEVSPEDWADYISFLSRLLKAVQSRPEIVNTLPYSSSIASKLAQCLNPMLPSGVHQKALEVYAYIFATFGDHHVSTSLDDYLPGLFPLLSFASLSVRPALYELLEDHILKLDLLQLRPVLKSFILSLLPALEDETSEDFDRALAIAVKLQHKFCSQSNDQIRDSASFFWQCVYLATITSPSRRQGALHFLTRQTPSFIAVTTKNITGADQQLSAQAEAAITPDPGLLIRAFACGLSDSQALIQRGFLDLLIATLPLHSPVLQHRVNQADLHMLLDAVLGILLRRDMSLNRRIWHWFLGPEAKDENGETITNGAHTQYFQTYGKQSLQACLIEAFSSSSKRVSERARPFRIALSLMDRSEIGGEIIPQIFLPAMRDAYAYCTRGSKHESTELLKSVNLFFDGIESKLIWSSLFRLLQLPTSTSNGTVSETSPQDLRIVAWILRTFNVREEDMTRIHSPLLALYVLATVASEGISSIHDVTNLLQLSVTLLNITSAKAFAASTSDEHTSFDTGLKDVRQLLTNFFQSDAEQDVPYEPGSLHSLTLHQAVTVFQTAWARADDQDLALAASIITAVLQKTPRSAPLDELVDTLEKCVAQSDAESVTFERLTVLINLIVTIETVSRPGECTYHHRFAELEPALMLGLFQYISPAQSTNNVEAVRLLWRLDSTFRNEEAIEASIQAFLTSPATREARTEHVRIVLNLWTLSAAAQPSTAKSPMMGIKRRSSGSVANADLERTSRVVSVLRGPLHIILDLLDDPTEPASTDIALWLNYSQHADIVVQMLVKNLDAARQGPGPTENEHVTNRAAYEACKQVAYNLRQISCILKHAQLAFWITLSELQLSDTLSGPSGLAPLVLVKHCLHLLPGTATTVEKLHDLALEILTQLLNGPPFIVAQLQTINIRASMIGHLMASLRPSLAHLQPAMLRVVARVFTLPLQESPARPDIPKHSVHIRRISMATPPTRHGTASIEDAIEPIHQLTPALRQALSSPSIRPYLDAWLDFLSEMLPMLGETLATSLIPLTETLCSQVETSLEQVMLASKRSGPVTDVFSPESTIVKLLDALEITLRTGHDLLHADETPAETGNTESVLNSVTPNMFKQQQGVPSKTAKSNTRLTVTLASKDVVRICVRMYVWSSTVSEDSGSDKTRAATTTHIALKLRNRARHMLEGIFSIDMMETLEVVALSWSEAETFEAKTTIMSLLQVLHTTRPKNTVPAILDTICSRTNVSILTADRQSSLTTDLSSPTLALFYSAYLEALEDDALDEVWSDCTAFMRDVLSNPLPYRSILPMLLWIAYQLAEKLDNTNFGEKRRMRRELGDYFQRLLTATFTTIPAGSLDIVEDRHSKETSFTHGLRDLNLLVILREIVAHVEVLLETSDRVAVSVNAITSYIITPTLRSKTFPSRVTADVLALVVRVAKKLPSSKLWRRDVADAFNDTRFIMTPASMVTRQWFPILHQLTMSDKERMPEILARLSAPSSAGIMFGVGANAARLDADRKTQLNLRRVALLCLASSVDGQIEHLRTISEKMVELFDATTVSSPSSVVKAELFLLIRALLLSVSPVHFASFWPIINDNLKQALLSMSMETSQSTAYTNLTLLQACKLLDLLVALSPEEFQLHEWVFITNSTDAVYHPPDWQPLAVADQLADSLSGLQLEEDAPLPDKESSASVHTEGHRGPLLRGGAGYDTEDVRAMSRDVLITNSLRPFLSQLSIHVYECRYRLEKVDVGSFRTTLVDDLQDAATIIT